MFEAKIASRREDIFKRKDNAAIEEMRRILNEYTEEKAREQQEEGNQ